MLLQVEGAERHYGGQTVLDGVSLGLHRGERLGLVGRNGAGKTTLLRLLTGEELPDGGRVVRAPGVRVAALAQVPDFGDAPSVGAVLDAANPELDALEAELDRAAQGMASGSEASVLRHEAVLERFTAAGGLTRRATRDAVVLAFGFRGREHVAVERLSGGERTRLNLAALLLSQPEVLLLDEPTNHLDLETVEWLEDYLSRYPGALLVISHDRAFLDNVTRATAYLEGGELTVYPFPYTRFREELEAERERQAARAAVDAAKVAALQRSTDRMKIWGLGMSKLARRAKAMETRLERLKAGSAQAPTPEQRTTRIVFHAPGSGELVLSGRHLSQNLGGRQLFSDLSLELRRGNRVALLGQNGSGKSTLLRTLLGEMPSQDPRAELRLGARVSLGYYDQKLSGLDPSSTLYDQARAHVPRDQDARDLLGTYMFPYEDQHKVVSQLSGGERARLALLKLAQEDHNLLVLDEPTNHLDMPMLERLEDALTEYAGTLLLVSHDRQLVQNLCDEFWWLHDGELSVFDDYGALMAARAAANAPAQAAPPPREAPRKRAPGRSRWHLKRDLEAAEEAVAQAEEALAKAQAALETAPVSADFTALGEAAAHAEVGVLQAMERWSELQAQLEAEETQ